jgi:hypothetical protein
MIERMYVFIRRCRAQCCVDMIVRWESSRSLVDVEGSLVTLLCRYAVFMGCWSGSPGLSLLHSSKADQLISGGRREPFLLGDKPGQQHHLHAAICRS